MIYDMRDFGQEESIGCHIILSSTGQGRGGGEAVTIPVTKANRGWGNTP